MFACLDFAPGQLPDDAPRYLMGVGKPDDIVGAVERGIDMFDCVLPTRSRPHRPGLHLGRPDQHPQREVRRGPGAARSRTRRSPAGRKAYLHHLVRSGEILGAMLMTEHNLWFYQRLMQELRDAIAEGGLAAYADAFRARYQARDASKSGRPDRRPRSAPAPDAAAQPRRQDGSRHRSARERHRRRRQAPPPLVDREIAPAAVRASAAGPAQRWSIAWRRRRHELAVAACRCTSAEHASRRHRRRDRRRLSASSRPSPLRPT